MPGRPKTYKRKPQSGETTSTAPQGKPKRRGKIAADQPVKMTRKGTVMSCSFCHQPNHNARSYPRKPSPPADMNERRGGLDIPAPVEEGTLRPKKKESTANVPPAQEVNEGMDPLSSVPGEWWNVTSAEQASQLTKEQVPTSQLTKEQGTPSRVTRSRATKIVDEAIRQSQGAAAATRSTLSRAAKKATSYGKNAKCTQESGSVVAEKSQPVRRKLQVQKAKTPRDPLDGPSIVKIDKPNPMHFIKPPAPTGASTLTSEVRFSKTSRDDPSQKVFISPDAPPNCKQM